MFVFRNTKNCLPLTFDKEPGAGGLQAAVGLF